MTTADFQRQIDNMTAALEQAGPGVALRMGQTGLTLVKERSIRDGIRQGATGSFAEYSTKSVSKSSFKGKARNAAGSAYANSGGKGTYGEFRAAQGLKSDHVNLFNTGRMWSALKVISQAQNGHRYSVLTGINDPEAALTLQGNLARYGNFLELTREEVNRIQDDAIEELNAIVRRFT